MSPASVEPRSPALQGRDDTDEDADGDDFGDDFDDFEEGGNDNDFDDFDDAGFQEAEVSAPAPAPPPEPSILSAPALSFVCNAFHICMMPWLRQDPAS